MNQIVLSDEQIKVVVTAISPVEVVDRHGNTLGYLPPLWTAEDLAAAREVLSSETEWFTTESVLAHLRSLDLQ
jgi:hypothetical protein